MKMLKPGTYVIADSKGNESIVELCNGLDGNYKVTYSWENGDTFKVALVRANKLRARECTKHELYLYKRVRELARKLESVKRVIGPLLETD